MFGELSQGLQGASQSQELRAARPVALRFEVLRQWSCAMPYKIPEDPTKIAFLRVMRWEEE